MRIIEQGPLARLAALSLAILAMLAFVGCRDVPEGALFEISGRIFVLNYRVATANYVVTLRPLGAVPEGLTASASFENPEGGAPLVIRQPVYPKLGKVVLESPPIFCLAKDRLYQAQIEILDRQGAIVQSISTKVLSTLDQSILPDRPLVVGPVYTPNPDLAGHPDGKVPGESRACPG